MNMRDFCFWLQGFFEINDKGPKQASYELTHQQIATIREHLNMVFEHVVGDAVAHEVKPEDEIICAPETKRPIQPDDNMKEILDKILKDKGNPQLRERPWPINPKVYC